MANRMFPDDVIKKEYLRRYYGQQSYGPALQDSNVADNIDRQRLREDDPNYAYDDAMPGDYSESLYKKAIHLLNVPYTHSEFLRGASDNSEFEAKKRAFQEGYYDGSSGVNDLATLGGIGTAIYGGGLDGPLERRGLGALFGILQSNNARMSGKFGAENPNRPYSQSEAYNHGVASVPASIGAGLAGISVGAKPSEYAPFLAWPFLASAANPKYNPLVKIAEYLDKQDE